MTDHETDQIIVEMVREKRELQRSIACREHQLAKAGEGFKAVQEAVKSYDTSGRQLHVHFPENIVFPDSDTFRGLLRDLESDRFKLQEVNRRLALC